MAQKNLLGHRTLLVNDRHKHILEKIWSQHKYNWGKTQHVGIQRWGKFERDYKWRQTYKTTQFGKAQNFKNYIEKKLAYKNKLKKRFCKKIFNNTGEVDFVFLGWHRRLKSTRLGQEGAYRRGKREELYSSWAELSYLQNG